MSTTKERLKRQGVNALIVAAVLLLCDALLWRSQSGPVVLFILATVLATGYGVWKLRQASKYKEPPV